MEPDLKWRRKRSGRRLRPPFIAAPPANREGCWAVTWRWARRAPCRAALGASEGRSGASCRGARGRQWERLREAKVAGAEGNNGGGTWESRGGTSIAALPVRSEVAGEGPRAWEERSVRREKRKGEKSWSQKSQAAPSQGHSPSCLERLCLWRPVQPTPSQEPSTPPFSALGPRVPSCCGGSCYRLAPRPGRSGKRRTAPGAGGEAASAPVSPSAHRAHACFVLELAETSPTGSGRAAAPPGSGVARAPLPLRPPARRPRGRGGPALPMSRNRDPARPLLLAEGGRGARARSDYCKYAKAEAVGGEGVGAVEGKGHSHPRRATRGAPVCTCPGPLPLAQPVRGERAPERPAPAFAPLFPPTRGPF